MGVSAGASSSITSRLPVVKPPSAPPSALPRVPVKISIWSSTPLTSADAAAGRAEEAGGVAFVDMHQRPVFARQAGDLVERRNGPIHGEHAIGRDQDVPHAVLPGLPELLFQVGHVAIGIAITLCLAQAHAIDDGGVVERIGDDRILLAEQGLEQAAVGIEAGGVEDAVLGAEEVGDPALRVACAGPGCRR